MTFTTLKETEKALFIEVSSIKTWIPKTWIKKDGNLSKKALWKIEEVKEDLDWEEQTKDYSFNRAVEIGDFYIERETEKALFIVGKKYAFGGDVEVKFWIPKSMKDNYKFMCKKSDEFGFFITLR